MTIIDAFSHAYEQRISLLTIRSRRAVCSPLQIIGAGDNQPIDNDALRYDVEYMKAVTKVRLGDEVSNT